ncbi:MAG: UDP-glucose 4-epimerase [Cryptosporangiaceae bacterium]|nr:UDP-glucose 4-epimerase [Cryptosporangiaceae bacterium]
MKLLVTGGAGYIGGVVTSQLVAAGHDVTVVDDLSTGYRDAVPEGADFHQLELQQIGQVLTPGSGFDGVLHFAAKIAAGESVVLPEKYWDSNVLGSVALLAAVRAAGVPRLIFSSTGSMYAAEGMEQLTEQARIDPQNPYAVSKHMVDTMLTWEASAHRLGAVSLRYFNAAGASGRWGERHDPETHLIPIALDVALGKREKLMLFGDDYPTPDGTCVRDYIHVEDLAQAHLLALGAATPGEHKIFNLGNGNGFSNKEVIEVVRSVTGAPVPVEHAPRRDGDAIVVVASSEKAKAELGWKPQKADLTAIIGDAWAFHRAHRA